MRFSHAQGLELPGFPRLDGDIRMTLHYTHSDLERRREGIEKMTARLYPDGAVGVIGCPNNDVKSRKVSEEAAGRSKVVGPLAPFDSS